MDIVRFDEGTAGKIEGDILDADDVPVPASQLIEATLTLYDWHTRVLRGSPLVGVINDRFQQDILNDHDVTIDEDGHFVWAVRAEDNPILTPIRQIERHRGVFFFAWNGGQFNMEFELEVMNLGGVLT
jgi:hypothetical protein